MNLTGGRYRVMTDYNCECVSKNATKLLKHAFQEWWGSGLPRTLNHNIIIFVAELMPDILVFNIHYYMRPDISNRD